MNFLQTKINEMKKRKEEGNKGFSLVELIIVIAIMAILVGIVGTQVIPYINKSKESKDLQIINSFSTAAVSSYTENADSITATNTLEVLVYGDLGSTDADKKLLATQIQKKTYETSFPKSKMQSTEGKKITDVKITFDFGNKTVKTEVVGSSAFKPVDANL